MPIRHEDDFQRRVIKSWDSWIDEAILEAQERGEFDNLPQQGKPLAIEESPFAPEMASAFRILKNAGYAPTWMEIDREITQAKVEMAEFLARSVAYLLEKQAQLSRSAETPPAPADQVKPGFWATVKHRLAFAKDVEQAAPNVLTLDDLVLIRARMREQYLERAAIVDKKITAFHAALPRNLWHLERMRLTPESAATTFDRECPYSMLVAGN